MIKKFVDLLTDTVLPVPRFALLPLTLLRNLRVLRLVLEFTSKATCDAFLLPQTCQVCYKLNLLMQWMVSSLSPFVFHPRYSSIAGVIASVYATAFVLLRSLDGER